VISISLSRLAVCFATSVAWFSLASCGFADDWPMWGRDWSHNAVSPEKGAPVDFAFERKDDNGKVIPAKNISWSAPAGGRAVGTPVVADGLVWVGTNHRYDPKKKDDASVLMCFRESDGKLLYEYISPRLGKDAQGFEDFPHSSMGCAPLIEGNRLWLINNRSEVVCWNIEPLKKGEAEPKLLWSVDLRKQFGVVPHFPMMMAGFHASVSGYKDWLYIVTANGVDDSHLMVPAPEAPSLVCLEKARGKLVWKDNSPGKNIINCQISTPLVMEVKGKAQVIVGQGDGWLRAFDAPSGRLIWKCDLNPKGSKFDWGRGQRNSVVATPVACDGFVYIAPGLDVEFAGGYGCLFCIDPSKEGDVSPELETEPGKGKPNPNSAAAWSTRDMKLPKLPKGLSDRGDYLFGRTISTCAIHDGLVYAAEVDGYVHCFDAKSGKHYWVHDAKSFFRTSPLCVDGKVYAVTEDGDVLIFACGKEEKLLAKIESDGMVSANPIFANGTLYITTDNKFFAIREKK
jgi:outer membrane protein assembly factor BamB